MVETTEPAINRLRKALIAQKQTFISEPEADSQLANVFEAIREYDIFVSQIVFRVLQGSGAAQQYPERARIDELFKTLPDLLTPIELRSFEKYKTYLEKLDHLLSLTQEVIQERSK
jgi:hypothetical protein